MPYFISFLKGSIQKCIHVYMFTIDCNFAIYKYKSEPLIFDFCFFFNIRFLSCSLFIHIYKKFDIN